MKYRFITGSGGSDRLILILAGWAMDANPFRFLKRPGYDIAVVWNYDSTEADWSFTESYREICLVAWSLGVAAAGITEPISGRITRRIAVAGTPVPIDDRTGIPRAIFEGTRRALSPAGLRKFYRRVAGSASAFESFMENAPERNIEELGAELDYFLSEDAPHSSGLPWDMAIVPENDAIFPPENQLRAWQNVMTYRIDSPHLPPFQEILDNYIIDKELTGERFRRNSGTYEANATVQSYMVRELADIIPLDGTLRFHNAYEPGCGQGALTRLLEPVCDDLLTCDIAHAPSSTAPHTRFILTDAELLTATLAAESMDLIASASVVQWFNSPRNFFEECYRVLRPGGLLAIATFCRGNLEQVAQCTGVELPLPDARGWLNLLPPRMKVLYSHDYSVNETFNSPMEVFRHLRLTGVTALDSKDASSRLRRGLAEYPCVDGKYPLIYRPIIFIAQK